MPASSLRIYQSLADSPSLEKQLEPFLKWLQESVVDHHKSPLEHGLGYLGAVVGFISTLSSYSMGSQFGHLMADTVRLPVLREPTGVICGATTLTAIGSLVMMPNKRIFENFARHLEGKQAFPSKQDRQSARLVAYAFETLFVSCAGIPFYYLLYENIEKNVLPWFAIAGSYFACLETASAFIRYLFDKYATETPEITAARIRLQQRFNRCYDLLLGMSDDDIQDMMTLLIENLNDHPNEHKTLTQTSLLANLNYLHLAYDEARVDIVEANVDELVAQRDYNDWIVKSIAAITGFFATIVLFDLSRSTAELWAEDLGGSATTKMWVANIITLLGISANMIFNIGYTIQSAAEKFDNIKNHRPMTKSSMIAQAIALISAISNTNIAIKAAHNVAGYLLIAPSFISPALAQSMGLEALLNEKTIEFREKFKPDEARTKRTRLLTIIGKIKTCFTGLAQEQLMAFDKALTSKQPQTIHLINAHRSGLFAANNRALELKSLKHDDEKNLYNEPRL